MSEVVIGFLAVLLFGLALYFLIALGWLRSTKLHCHKVGVEVRRIERRLSQIISLRRSFDSYREEPFVTSLNDIDAEMEALQKRVKGHVQQYIRLRGQLTRIEKSAVWNLRGRWNILCIRNLRNHCLQCRNNCDALEQELKHIETRFDQIKEFPWSIALQCRELMEYFQQAKSLLSELGKLGLCGNEYEGQLVQLNEIDRDIQDIPVYFLSEPYETLVNEVNQEDVRMVFQIVQRDLPSILNIIQQADRWRNQFLALDHQVALAFKEFERFAQLISYFPDEIDLREQKLKLGEWKNLLEQLQGNRNNLANEKIAGLASELSNFIHRIQGEQQFLRQRRQQFFQYQRLVQSIRELADKIKSRFDAIGKASLSIEWDFSGDRFRQAIEKYQMLLSTNQPYSLDTLIPLVKEAAELQSIFLEINQQTAQVEILHRDCMRLYQSQEISKAKQWIEEAKKLADAIRPYDPRNWPNRDWVVTFDKHLQELEKNYEYLTEKLTSKKLSESSISQLASTMDEVFRQMVTFRERMSVIDQVFRNLVNNERRNLELLKTSRNQFAQITMFVLSQPLLADKAEKEIVQLDRRFDLCEAAFRQREKDTLTHKQSKLNQLNMDIEQAANRWMSIVESDCLKLLADLEKRISRLDQIGLFEDGLIYRAKELLARKEEIFDFRRTSRMSIPMEKLVGGMKIVFDTWQESFAVSKQLAEQVEKPLLSVYQEFQTLQKTTQAKFLDLQKIIPAQRKWPPNSLMLTVERNEILQLDEKWENIQSQPISVIQLVKALGEMISGYRSLLEKFLQYEQWATQEQARIERIEADIYRYDRLWEIQQRRFAQVPEIEGQIRELRQKAQGELSSLRQYWLTNASRRPPSVDYDVVLRKLIELSRHLANAKIVVINELGQQEMMDINGQVILKV